MAPLYHGNTKLDLVVGKTIFDYADALKVRVPTSCGRSGECHECIVEIRQGVKALNPPTASENFLRGDFRLACQATVVNPSSDIEFAILRRQPRILTQSIRRNVELDPILFRRKTSVFRGDERVDDYRGNILGLAIDIGTTTIAFNLVDLENATILYTGSFENPQKFGGSDVMHRISYDAGPNHGELQKVMISAINFEIGDMVRKLNKLKIHRRQIYEVVVVGNSTMRDLLFGLQVQSIGEKPYKSLLELEDERGNRNGTSITVKAKEIGLRIFPLADVYGGPLIGCHVGSDIAADLLAIGMDQQDHDVMLVDIGTNTEIVIGNRDRMLAASCPAGPAFEGGEISYGMPGYQGAIESVTLHGSNVKYSTIENQEPQGICGSGLIDILAELRRTGQMTELGVLPNGEETFSVVPDKGISISRSDISSLAQAKSATYSGQYIAMRRYGAPPEKIFKLYLAGGFANYIKIQSATSIGFLPNIPAERIVKVGNAALEGATIMLISQHMRSVIQQMARNIEHIELETTPDFFEIFVEGCMFNPMTTTIS